MKRCFIALLAVVFPLVVSATVRVTITDGISNDVIKKKMERQMSAMLTGLTNACENGGKPNFAYMKMSSEVQDAIDALWDNSPIACVVEEISEHCLTTGTGYQIRNIPLVLKTDSGDEYQEAVVSFNKNGDISNFNIAVSMQLYMGVISKNKDVTDLHRRELILDYVEQFRTSYNQKDIKFLEQVFSDDALIITGRVVKSKPIDGIKIPEKIEYKKQSKSEYLGKLKQVFAANKHIRVTFNDIKVMLHPNNPNIYGVTLQQGYTSDRYHDDGYLFLMWDFTNEAAPEIHVRTWQPEKYNGRKLSEKEIFSINDFY